MKVFIEKDSSTKEIDFSGTVLELLNKLEIVSEDVIVSVNNEISLLSDELKGDEKIDILSVISGG